MSNLINSKLTIISKIGEDAVVTASRSKPEPTNASVINLFTANIKKIKNEGAGPSESLGGEE